MMEDTELLKATIAVALADGQLLRSELGVIKALAQRAGVGETSLKAMIEAAEQDESFADDIMISSREKAQLAVKLLVAEARIDREISEEERRVITRIATSLGITGNEFEQLYLAGIEQADRTRRSRQAQQ